MKKEFLPLSRLEGVVVQDLAGELLVYDLENDRAFCLNETSAFVWKACDGTKSVAELSRALSKTLKADVSEDLIYLALDQLSEEKLMMTEARLDKKFAGMSRRDAIKKIGLATAVALPVVASLTSPKASEAASNCIAQGQPCTGNPPCCAPFACQFNQQTYQVTCQ